MLVELFFFFIEEIVFWPLFLFWLLSFTLSSLIRWKHLHFLRSRVFIQFHSKHEKKNFFKIINLRFFLMDKKYKLNSEGIKCKFSRQIYFLTLNDIFLLVITLKKDIRFILINKHFWKNMSQLFGTKFKI